ncbi:putative aromatic di-alanine and TPR containing protein [Rhizoctonia solani 123E]|uniref:Putative aromatic di-alanine and TPR containing protein n=1 Tax=Rhizoctonia solani 123E TaxID=1423351 RepID=A0A074RL37_9AGAM|nr:putative aromatic di-alanine and TPR containing protein [Rhizoctonia solani 123E]
MNGDVVLEENDSKSFELFSKATELWSNFLDLDSLSDLNNGIQYLVESISLLPDGDPRIPGRLDCLCTSYRTRFEYLENLEDLNQTIEHGTRAYNLTIKGDPNPPIRLCNMYIAHQYRYERQGNLDDLNKSIDYALQARSLTLEDYSNLPELLSDLGLGLLQRFKLLGNMEDLSKALDCFTQARVLTPEGDSNLPDRLNNLSAAFFERQMSQGNLEDLNTSIEYATQAYSLTPEGDLDLPTRLSSLCVSHCQRFQYLRELNDVDKAIDYGTQSCLLKPCGDSLLPGRLMYLGIAYHERFIYLGDPDDLSKSIEHKLRAYHIAPADYSQLPLLLCSLGASYHKRFISAETPSIHDIDRAIQLQEQAKSLIPEGDPLSHKWLSRLGSSYHRRAQYSNSIDDLNKAIENSFQAHSLTPAGDPSIAWQLSNIGALSFARFECFGGLEDLNNTIEYHKLAYTAMSRQHPDLTLVLKYLGKCYECRFKLLQDEYSLNSALNYFRQATHSAGYPNSRLESALDWGRMAAKNGIPDHLQGYQAAIELIPEVIWVGLTVNHRYRTLGQLSSVAIEAASAAIASNQLDLALEWLEQGRSIVWNQTLLLRSPLDELRETFPALADRLELTRDELHQISSRSISDSQEVVLNLPKPEQVAQQHHQLAKEYADQIAHIRGLPGLSNFMKPKMAMDLVCAACVGPVVVINCHDSRCDALIIFPRSSKIIHVALPTFTNKDASQLWSELEWLLAGDHMRQRGVRVRQQSTESQVGFKCILATLWNSIVKCVFDLLQLKTEIDKLPQITWCTTGELSFLPLHAAGDYDQPNSSVFDYAISSYASTLTALFNSSPSPSYQHSSLLAIGQEATPGHSWLPGTTKELAYIHKRVTSTIQHTQLVNKAATTDAVLKAMEQHDWVHLSCHANQNAKDPTQSGFFLHDGTLDLTAIMQKSFKNKGLAFLSACQTARGDDNLPEEAIHLALGLLTAGYTSVIASMWVVDD